MDPDQEERIRYNEMIARTNKRNPTRFTCPTCKTIGALSAWEHSKGYQCKHCADLEEGPRYFDER